MSLTQIETLLSARLFLTPQVVADRIFFISDLSGRLSLYAMDFGGSVPEPLLPPHIALQNPHHVAGYSFVVLPRLNQIVVMLDDNGNEHYQPMLIPIDGGFPEPLFSDELATAQVTLQHKDLERNLLYFTTQGQDEARYGAFRADLNSRSIEHLIDRPLGIDLMHINADHTRLLWLEFYGIGDHVVFEQQQGQERRTIYGVPLEQREADHQASLNNIFAGHFVCNDTAMLGISVLFSDTYGLTLVALDGSGAAQAVDVHGIVHTGIGEMESLTHITGDRYTVGYNIDGCSWLYEGTFDAEHLVMNVDHVLCGKGKLANGVLEAVQYDAAGDRYALSFSTATSPTQLYTIEGSARDQLVQHTRERIVGVPQHLLAAGEDASFTSFDGLRISARLYLPAADLGFDGPRPLVYYIHGGPQSQERPDFAWFSMPLIQFLTLNGFAVFVPNARGSTGYGFAYMNRVVRNWGGDDRFDHVHAMTQVLPNDGRIDTRRAGVIGRSYGGYMTLTLAARHPELWSAAVDMFGPYDLLTFTERVPASWKPYIAALVGDPVTEADFLRERSPRTYMENIACPLLVLQGRNDPRVIAQESQDVVAHLEELGKQAEIYIFEDEGHDVLKFGNKVRCYSMITDFFRRYLQP